MKEEGGQNLMAGKTICPILQGYYGLSASEKEKFLKTREGSFLLENLPPKIRSILVDGFLRGLTGEEVPGWEEVVSFFRESRTMFKLSENPGTSFGTDLMYKLIPAADPIEEYFLMSKAGGVSLRGRFDSVVSKSIGFIGEKLEKGKSCLIADFGAGAGTTAVEIIELMKRERNRIRIDCIDIDEKSLSIGRELCKKKGIKEIAFVRSDMAKLRDFYKDDNKIDLGLLIGVLCGMTYRQRVLLLKTLKRYFKPGGKIVAAALLEKMAQDDLLSAYILRETTGWHLHYRPLGELKAAFEEAGWKYLGYFQEEPTRFYEIGIGEV
jgi:ubiquinone/menaquinone biosynthesis C-methylase UbiE